MNESLLLPVLSHIFSTKKKLRIRKARRTKQKLVLFVLLSFKEGITISAFIALDSLYSCFTRRLRSGIALRQNLTTDIEVFVFVFLNVIVIFVIAIAVALRAIAIDVASLRLRSRF